ncbi:MAG TPA: hypothetical protein VGR16_06350 [Thermomicrobiales bacterium]|nr:hypothetical protein [Thermomicrobiales bacterium]
MGSQQQGERRKIGIFATCMLALFLALSLGAGGWATGARAALQGDATPETEATSAEADVTLAVSDEEINFDAPVTAVIAQGLTYVDADQLVWRVSQITPAGVDDAESVTDDNTWFALQRTGATVIRNDVTNKRARIEVGEAYFAAAGDPYTLANYEDDESQVWLIELVPADSEPSEGVIYESEPFGDVAEGTYDLELTRGVLFPDDEDILLVENGAAMVMASFGSVEVTPGTDAPVSLDVGDAVLADGDVAIRNTGPDTVVYVMASLGERVLDPGETADGQPETDASPPAEDVETDVEADGTPAADTAPDPGDEADPDETTTDLGVPAVEGDDGTDSDGDRLTDAQELELGTDPNVVDTDADSMDDGTEVIDFGTDPLNPDSDADGFLDGDEQYLYGTDPLDASSFPEAP